MIEVQYKTESAYSFHAFSLKELKAEINAAMHGAKLSAAAAVLKVEKKTTQKALAAKLGVSTRYLRYIKTGKRLTKPGSKKDKSILTKLLSIAGRTGGAYTSGQLRAANYLDFVCERGGEVAKDIHTTYYEHGAMSIKNLDYVGLFDVLTNNMHDAIESMCQEGSYCEDVTVYRRGNKHPKKPPLCPECEEPYITVDNKKLIYSVVMIKA